MFCCIYASELSGKPLTKVTVCVGLPNLYVYPFDFNFS